MKRRIRIAQVVYQPSYGWPETRFEVQANRWEGKLSDPIVVTSPSEAQDVADKLAADLGGGHIYRGHLPDDWAHALNHLPRS